MAIETIWRRSQSPHSRTSSLSPARTPSTRYDQQHNAAQHTASQDTIHPTPATNTPIIRHKEGNNVQKRDQQEGMSMADGTTPNAISPNGATTTPTTRRRTRTSTPAPTATPTTPVRKRTTPAKPSTKPSTNAP